jgi:hypothetical protein
MSQAQGDLLQHREIEVDRIPAGDHVDVQLADASAERVECRVLVDAADCLFRHRTLAAVDDQYFIEPRRVQRNREQSLALRIRLDIERQHARSDRHVSGA